MKKPATKARGKTKPPNKVDFLKARGKVVRPEPFAKKVDFSKFKAVPSASDIAKLAWGRLAQRSGSNHQSRCSVPPRPSGAVTTHL